MYHALREIGKYVAGLKAHFLVKQGGSLQRQVVSHPGCSVFAPLAAPRVGHAMSVGAAAQMQIGEHLAHLSAVEAGRAADRLPGQAADDSGRLAVQVSYHVIFQVCNRPRTGHAVIGQVGHEADKERQLLLGKLLEQGEHIATMGGGKKIIGVLDAVRNALQLKKIAQYIIFQPSPGFIGADLGEYRHI